MLIAQYKPVLDNDGNQIYDEEGKVMDIMQPICLVNKKFSEEASRWSTIEQEGCGIYFGFKAFEY
jgi:hypothetical protein